MAKPYADLHIHSLFSDGSLSPEEIVQSAVENDIGLLAVADHNVAEGSLAVQKLCLTSGIHCISAVEIDALDGNTNIHILAYGVDFNDAAFRNYLSHTRFLLDECSVKLVEAMQADYIGVSLSDFFDFSFNRRLGGWKGLHYMYEKGITASLKEGIPMYRKHGVIPSNSGFSTVAAAAHRIHRAGGHAVLAHPGEVFDTSDITNFKKEVARVMAYGLDGIECYHPRHSLKVTQACLEYCRKRNLLITGGSDSHGVFAGAGIGALKIMVDDLELSLPRAGLARPLQ